MAFFYGFLWPGCFLENNSFVRSAIRFRFIACCLHFGQRRRINQFEIGEETSFLIKESRRLRDLYPKMCVAPMLYNVHSNELFLILDDQI